MTDMTSWAQWAVVLALVALSGPFSHFGVARNDVTIFRRGSKIVWRLDSWRARRWFKQHFTGEVIDHRIVVDLDREQEMREQVYAIGVREGPTGFSFRTAPDEP